MRVTQKVKKILDWYEGDPPGVKANLARILSTGKLGGTGKVVILPVDQGFEHGPARSFAPNPPAYDPHYHFQLAIDAELNAYAAPLGFIEARAGTYAGQLPAQLGAHIIKVKPPTAHLELAAAKAVYEKQNIDISTPAARIRHVVQSAFNGRRIVISSGGEAKDLDGVFDEVRAIYAGGANGSIIGRNTFQRSKADALDMLNKIIKIYQGRD